MSMANELAFKKDSNTPFHTNDLPKPIRIIPKAAQRRESPSTRLRQENNSFLSSSRLNSSHLTPAAIPRPANMSKCRERIRVGTGAAVDVSREIVSEKLHRERPISREKPAQDSVIQLSNRPPLVNQSFSKENQQRSQAPLKVRKNSELPEHKSAMIPSGCTGKLIERSRQKVAEKHASRIETSKNRDATPNQQDQLLSMIEVTKSNLYKDQQVIRHYMHKHKRTIDSLEQKCYEKSFERRKI